MLRASGEINIVLSHPKTGGNTLKTAVSELRPKSSVYFAHYTNSIDPASPVAGLRQRLPSLELDNNLRGARKLHRQIRDNMRGGAQVARFINEVCYGRNPKPPSLNIIAAVREPVACYLSGYFQILGDTGFRKIPVERVSSDIERMMRQTAPVNQLLWWNREVRELLGFDILTQSFDRLQGWQLYELGRCRLLVIRQENFASLGRAFSELFGTDSAALAAIKSNAAEEKAFLSADYAEKAKQCVFSTELLDQLYHNPWFQTFYTPEEESSFRRHWQGRPGSVGAKSSSNLISLVHHA
jgi:hypothetical protein